MKKLLSLALSLLLACSLCTALAADYSDVFTNFDLRDSWTAATALHGALLPVLKRFQAGHPQVRCCIRNDTNQQTTQALLDGEADIALVTSPVSLPGSVRRTSLSSFQELLVGGRQFAALAQGAHTLRELTQYPWIGLRRGTQTHAWHTQLFLREQLIYCPDVEAATAAQLLPLLLHQLGIGFIPQFFAAEALAAGDLVAIPLQCDWPRRQIYLLEDTARPLNRWAEPLRQLLLESAQA